MNWLVCLILVALGGAMATLLFRRRVDQRGLANAQQLRDLYAEVVELHQDYERRLKVLKTQVAEGLDPHDNVPGARIAASRRDEAYRQALRWEGCRLEREEQILVAAVLRYFRFRPPRMRAEPVTVLSYVRQESAEIGPARAERVRLVSEALEELQARRNDVEDAFREMQQARSRRVEASMAGLQAVDRTGAR